MYPRDPEDGPSCAEECCDCCGELWAIETERRYGPRMLRLCEHHADLWLKGEQELYAELEEMAGREPPRRPRPGTAPALASVGHGMDKRRRARRAS